MASLRDHPNENPGQIGSYLRSEGVNDTKGAFFIVRAKAVVGAAAVAERAGGDISDRCDKDTYGPFGFHEWNEATGLCWCGASERPDASTGAHLIQFAGLKFVNTILDVFPAGLIIYLESTPEAEEEQLATWPHTGGRTLQELFRQIIEWDDAYLFFDNREQVAVVCHEVLAQLGMPTDVRDWIVSEVPAQKVERFILGDPTARERHPGVPDMSDEFDAWITGLLETSKGLGDRHVN